jgi:hypothetical protein
MTKGLGGAICAGRPDAIFASTGVSTGPTRGVDGLHLKKLACSPDCKRLRLLAGQLPVALQATGIPGQPAWPRYNAKTDAIMNFTNNGAIAGPDPWKARLDLAELLNDSNEHKAGKQEE